MQGCFFCQSTAESFPFRYKNAPAATGTAFFSSGLDSVSEPELWKRKKVNIMLSAYLSGSFTFASSFGCWCYAYYPGPGGGLC